MNSPDKPDRELAELISDWHDDILTPETRSRLVDRLESEPSSRRAFLEASQLEAMFHLEFPDSVVHFPKRAHLWHRKPPIWLAAAACVAITVAWAFHSARPSTVPAQAQTRAIHTPNSPSKAPLLESSPVARVTAMTDLLPNNKRKSLAIGSLLPPGPIEFASGSIELTFFSGARVTLQGPCNFNLKSDFRATLSRGRLTAQVPHQAIGFTIHTPGGQLRDLGTAFAINVNRQGDAEIHVLDGKIEAGPHDATSLATLTEKQATRMSHGQLSPIPFRADGWPQRPTKSKAPLPKAVRWTLDDFTGAQSLDTASIHPLWMRSTNSKKSDPSERLIKGIKGQALSFNGTDEFAESSYRGVAGSQARAVALWVRIPPDASYRYPNGIVSWGTAQQSRKWQVCWNNGDQGTVGAPRVEFGDGYVIGTTDLRDGRWHHLAAVYLGGSGSDVGSHVKIYVDGRLETLSGRRSQDIRTDTESKRSIAVTLGRWLGNMPDKRPLLFRGDVDDVAIFEDALSPDQVMSLATP